MYLIQDCVMVALNETVSFNLKKPFCLFVCLFVLFLFLYCVCFVFSQPSIYIDGWLYGMSRTSVVCNVPVLSQNDSTYHHSVFTT